MPRLALAKELTAQTRFADAMRASLPLLAAQMRANLGQRGLLDGDAETFTALFLQRAAAEMDRHTATVAEAYAGLFTEARIGRRPGLRPHARAKSVSAS